MTRFLGAFVPQSVLPGGGRTSAGGTNSLTGSVGQAALGTASDGGRFTLFGGFWAAAAAQRLSDDHSCADNAQFPGHSWHDNQSSFHANRR
ncbi:MAG: hypothetical protein U0Y68_09355 [Blastocatellia bacterium]